VGIIVHNVIIKFAIAIQVTRGNVCGMHKEFMWITKKERKNWETKAEGGGGNVKVQLKRANPKAVDRIRLGYGSTPFLHIVTNLRTP
jgi:hypothetical protein